MKPYKCGAEVFLLGRLVTGTSIGLLSNVVPLYQASSSSPSVVWRFVVLVRAVERDEVIDVRSVLFCPHGGRKECWKAFWGEREVVTNWCPKASGIPGHTHRFWIYTIFC